MCVSVSVCVFTQSSTEDRMQHRVKFMQDKISLTSKFSFSKNRCITRQNDPYY